MDLGLRGKVVVVAAASQGMGLATARALAQEGCKVAICARNQAPLEKAAAAIRNDTGAEVLAVRADMSRAPDVDAFVKAALAYFGGVDLLVPNAGGPAAGRADALTDEQWSQAFDLTFQSANRLIRASLPSMRSRGGGSIVAITSISVKQPVDNLVLSNAIRAAVVGLVKTLARELASDKIRVNAVAPGWIATDRLLDLMRDRAKRETRRCRPREACRGGRSPHRRTSRPSGPLRSRPRSGGIPRSGRGSEAVFGCGGASRSTRRRRHRPGESGGRLAGGLPRPSRFSGGDDIGSSPRITDDSAFPRGLTD